MKIDRSRYIFYLSMDLGRMVVLVVPFLFALFIIPNIQ